MSQDTSTHQDDSNCPFCAIVSQDAPAIRIHETEDSLSIVPRTPGFKGHMMVIPKNHHPTLQDLPSEKLNSVMNHVQEITSVLDSIGFEGFNLINANGEAAQQSVPHFHMHIIPRKNDDQINIWAGEDEQGIYDDPLYDEISALI